MFESFFDRGLSPPNVFLIGKCYSTDLDTYENFLQLGANICPSSIIFNKNIPFDVSYFDCIGSFVTRALNQISLDKNKTVVVFDDGGDLIRYLNPLCKTQKLNFTCLEQTTSGYEKIKNLDLNMSVVNVARSFVKLNYESKIIAQTAITAICDKIFLAPKSARKVMILGNGAIGSAIASRLREGCDVSLIDIKPERSELSYPQCIENISQYDFIVGCAGKMVLSSDQIKELRPGTTLISLSSSDREFDIVTLRQQSPNIFSCHDDFLGGQGVRILNCGFPVNFCGNASVVDIEEFELTRSLLTLGMLQAIELKKEKGLFSMNLLDQIKLIDVYKEKYG